MSSKDLEKDLEKKGTMDEKQSQQDIPEIETTEINDVSNEEIASGDIKDKIEQPTDKVNPQLDATDQTNPQQEDQPIVDSQAEETKELDEQEQQLDTQEKQDIEKNSDVQEEVVEEKQVEAQVQAEAEVPTKVEEQTETEEQAEAQEKQEQSDDIQEENKNKEEKTPEEKKPSKFLLFLKKYRLPLIIAAAAILIAAAIFTTITVINAPKIFVRSAEDFLDDTAKKDIYILKKDITVDGDLTLNDDLNIDLNDKTLTVNGTLKINLNDNVNSTINVGTLKKKEFVAGGKIVADKIDISAKSANLNFYSSLYTNGIIRAKKLNIYENITVTDNGILEVRSTDISAQSSIIGNLSLFTSSLELYKDAAINSIVSDEFSNAAIYGKVINSLTGGDEISILGEASCPEVSNVKSLYFQQDTATIDNAINITNLYIVNQLETPAQLNIEQTGTTFKCIAAEVNNADLYIFTIRDDEELIAEIESQTNQTDITRYITQPKNYKISVKASSSNPRINIPSKELQIDYNYLIKLESPALTITKTEENHIVLSFPSINFATVYILDINGKTKEVEASDNQTTSIDLTEDMEKAGAYYIKVKASFPTNSSFTDSDTVMISYLKTIKLEIPELTVERSGDSIILNWQKINNADNYVLSYGEDSIKIMTKNDSVTFSAENIDDGAVFSLYAQGKGYYQTSEIATITFEYEQLDQPEMPQYIVIEGVMTIATEEVENAEQYTLYKNGQEIATSSTPEFTLTEFADNDKFKIAVSAEYYREAVSEELMVQFK